MKTELSHDFVLSVLDYNPETGVFVWKGSRRPGHNGKVAGKVGGGTYNYAVIGLNGRNYGISRLAWFYVNGEWPKHQLRFINGDASDARISNLRENIATKKFKNGKPSFDMSLPVHKQRLNPVTGRRANLKSCFGISPGEYGEMLAAQKGVCAICFQPETVVFRGFIKNMAVDHDHATGRVRALLCSQCNSGLGYFKDDPDAIMRASAYVRRHAALADNVVPLKRKA